MTIDSSDVADIRGLVRSAGISPFYCNRTGDFILIHGDCREILPRLSNAGIAPQLVFADPPYHLSNDGITCQSGQMVSVNKGDWDKSSGVHQDHEFVLSWLQPCLSALSTGGSFWISGTHHVIFSVGYGLQELGAKILNVIVWEKTSPPPNLSCRYYTHSHEFVIWSKRSEQEKHTFHYAFEKQENGGKQQKDVWYRRNVDDSGGETIPNHWRIGAPRKAEKQFGKHPTQKPVELLDRIIRCSSNPGDLVLDPFCGSGSTGIAALGNQRSFIGIDVDIAHLELAKRRAKEWKSVL
jgi:site-specific DNA-methyltransferase (adenine-specific)